MNLADIWIKSAQMLLKVQILNSVTFESITGYDNSTNTHRSRRLHQCRSSILQKPPRSGIRRLCRPLKIHQFRNRPETRCAEANLFTYPPGELDHWRSVRATGRGFCDYM